MRSFATKGQIIRLGARVAKILPAADARYNRLGAEIGWVLFVNAHIKRLPNLVRVKGRAQRTVIAYLDGIGELKKQHRPGTATAEGTWHVVRGDWISAFVALVRVIFYFGAKERFKESSKVNMGCAQILECYRLVSVVPKGFAFVRELEAFGTSREGAQRGGKVGIRLNDKIKVSWSGKFIEVS